MSKKKAFGGSTMTLKDFHGGSIPSDLPLPSAPGVTVRPTDRPGFERPASWVNPAGRPDHRAWLNSSTVARHFDDNTPFLSHTAPIGRNFDEDERKPLDGTSAPRRTVSDDSVRLPPARLELKPQPLYAGRVSSSQQGLAPFSPGASQQQSAYLGRVSGGGHVASSQNVYGNSGQGVPGSSPNAWAIRKEAVSAIEPVQSAWSASTAASKLVHASALEKVSSGRWQSKQSSPYEADIEPDSGLNIKGYDEGKHSRIDGVGSQGYVDSALPRQIERHLSIGEGIHGRRKEVLESEVAENPIGSDEKERNVATHSGAFQPVHVEGRFGRADAQHPVLAEASERPKLKLLPRSKPVDTPEQTYIEHKQVHQKSVDAAHSEIINEVHGTTQAAKQLVGPEIGNQTVERPKLNLKPRSQSLEQSEAIPERDRKVVFGGARPRELVLKERGVDDTSMNSYDLGQSSDRPKINVQKTERVSGNVAPGRHGEKAEKPAIDQRNAGRKFEKKDHHLDDRNDPQRRSWRNENWKNARDAEKQLQNQHHQQERRPSPEIWRKPVEEAKPASPETGVRFGKAASAAELAQAFSRPYSAPKTPDQFPGQRGVPGQTQVPFSRLTGGPSPRPQINGY